MRFFWSHATVIALCLLSLTIQCFGELIMIRHAPEIENGLSVQKLTCVSENDDSALVWNGFPAGDNKFPVNNSVELNNLVSSIKPDFFAFSARGSSDIKLRIRGSGALRSECFLITFSSSNIRNSSICPCNNATHCSHTKLEQSQVNVREFEWQTYSVKWKLGKDSNTFQVLKVFYRTEKIMEKPLQNWTEFNYTFDENKNGMRFRAHKYNYIWTTNNRMHLNSKTADRLSIKTNPEQQNLFVEMFVNICKKCQLNVYVVDANGRDLADTTIYPNKTAQLWQFEQRNFIFNRKNYATPIMLKIVTTTNNITESWWAIGPFRYYESPDEPKRGTRRSTKKFTLTAKTSHFSCQKLSRTENLIVHSNRGITNINSDILDQCLQDGSGPFCDFGCNGSCNGTSICNPSGCTCTPGFRGDNCTEECPWNHYGYNCQETCDCNNQSCNKTTGYCFPTEPRGLTVIPWDNGSVTVKWKHYREFWENSTDFRVLINLLGSTNQTNPIKNELFNISAQQPTLKKGSAKTEPIKYQMTLNLSLPNNYSFSVQTIDNRLGSSKIVKVFYFVLTGVSFPSKEELLENPNLPSMNFSVPFFENISREGIVRVIVHGLSTCPSSTKPQNQTEIENLEDGIYPVCSLRFNQIYLLKIKNKKSGFIWLVSLPASAISCLLIYAIHQKYGHGSVSLKSPVLRFVGNAPNQLIREPEESSFHNSVSPEVQKFMSFENYVRRASENGVLQQQFMWLPKGMMRSCEYGKLPANKPKNRYGNLIPYDETRVLLARVSRGGCSDYINANYVHGYCKEKAYIATQGPLPETVMDFWRMIWQEEVRIICMLVDLVENGRNMCEKYWPEVGEEMEFGNIIVLTTNQHVYADYTYRTFLVSTCGGSATQIVQHLQYTGWPEEGVPMYSHSVAEYLHKMLSVCPGQGPIVVHCSPGTGRTGTVILCDICLRHLAAEGTVDVYAEAKKMYSARGNMLTNFSQYVLAHLVPTQCLLSLPSKVLCADITQEKIEEMKYDLPAHMQRLEDSSWMDKALRPLEPIRPPLQENILKNRFPKLTPVGPSLVTLTRYPTYDTNSDYISAVSVDGAKIRKQYLASQLPMPSTLTDFWRLIVEKHIELVIVLQEPDLEDETCCDVTPRGTTLIPVPYLKVETKMRSDTSQYFRTDKLVLTDTSKEPATARSITILTCKNWSHAEEARPPPPEALVELWQASEKIQRVDGRTLVLCHNGLTGCGLYLALSFMLDRMGVEQECDVILAVRAVRRSRQDFVLPQWQFEYLYDAAVKYVESFSDYGNFSRAG